MGIRFYCPNGHKLNVKDFLAGQRGICPKCGAKMEIPFRSTRPAGSHDLPQAAEWEARAREAGKLPDASARSAQPVNLNAIQPDDPLPASSVGWKDDDPAANFPVDGKPLPTPGKASSGTTSKPSLPSPPPAPEPPKPSFPDPFDGPKDAVWYVRSSAGGQYGPADNESIKQWLTEGRIAADTLVWREGWAEWKRGDEVFESLASPFKF